MTRFRHHSAIFIMAILALLASMSLFYEGTLGLRDGSAKAVLVLTPLIPLAAAWWAWRSGTDANTYGIRVRALFGRRVVAWDEVEALVPNQHGGAYATLRDGASLRLTAVKATDLPRLAAARTPTDRAQL